MQNANLMDGKLNKLSFRKVAQDKTCFRQFLLFVYIFWIIALPDTTGSQLEDLTPSQAEKSHL